MVTLCSTPLTLDNEHQIKFASKTEQSNYFLGCSVLNITDFTFQRKDSVIRVNQNIENLYNCNYVMYQNSHFSLKWFYAYITKLEYVNEQVTFIHIKTDVFQTWFFDLTFNKSFIDRQHPVTDEYNTINDTVAHGQLVQKQSSLHILSGGYFVFCSGDITQDSQLESGVFNFKVDDYVIPCWVIYFAENDSEKMGKVIQSINAQGWGDRILSCVYIPFIGNKYDLHLEIIPTELTPFGPISICTGFTSGSISMKRTISMDLLNLGSTYKKHLTFPYSNLVLTDTATGQSIELCPEKFSSTTVEFEIRGTISETPSYRVIPKNYKGQELAYNDSLVIKCNTSLPLSTNQYAKYLMMNNEINNNNKVFAALSSAVGVATKNPGAAVGGLEQIINITAQENAQSKVANQVTAITDGAMERLCFTNELKLTLFSTDDNHNHMANDFWNMYGYPVHELEYPNLSSRADFNYVKMVNPNIEGSNVPGDDMIEIENLFTNGLTLWHTTTGFRNY